MLTNQATGPDVFPEAAQAGERSVVCSPGKRSATGEDGGASDRKTQKQKAQSSD
ncbi:hypothetical protein [Klebsiella aerogenes]|uniref:hypothetical protein n=1 Tax=Klebsiella aerogenes TaxID=548 RepID=UPI0013DD9355|nr:hypothetical protein [Klebsiella aerogenes]